MTKSTYTTEIIEEGSIKARTDDAQKYIEVTVCDYEFNLLKTSVPDLIKALEQLSFMEEK